MRKRKTNNVYRKAIINYLGEKCVWCGIEKNLSVHHIIPIYLGGNNTLGNMEVVCKDCHYKLHAQIIKIFKKKSEAYTICRVCGRNTKRNYICDSCHYKRYKEKRSKEKKIKYHNNKLKV